MAVGAAFSVPTFMNMLGYRQGIGLSAGRWMLLKVTYLSLNFGLLAFFAILASIRAPAVNRPVVRGATAAGLGLLVAAVVVAMTQGNEHNLVNAAGVLLGVPAGIHPWCSTRLGPRASSKALRAAGLLLLLHLPTTAATVLAFDGRAPLPLSYVRQLERLPVDHPLAQLYRWIRAETPRDSVLVADPDRPIKMSGNASEIPAFTGRVLFVDEPNYLTRPNPEFTDRIRLARALIKGEAASPSDRQQLHKLGRPLYVVSADPANRPALEARYGNAVFASGFVTVFRVPADDRPLVHGP
jgi:hypothetical protein